MKAPTEDLSPFAGVFQSHSLCRLSGTRHVKKAEFWGMKETAFAGKCDRDVIGNPFEKILRNRDEVKKKRSK